jgi:hypothetical protein
LPLLLWDSQVTGTDVGNDDESQWVAATNKENPENKPNSYREILQIFAENILYFQTK